MKKLCILILLSFLMTSLFGCTPPAGETEPSKTSPTTTQQQTPPVTTPAQETTTPTTPTEGEIYWRMDSKMITADGQLISSGSMIIEGSIIKQEDANDLLLLSITLPTTVHYRFTDYSNSEEGFFLMETELPYYFSLGFCYSIVDKELIFYHFALDAEAGYLIME